MSARRLVDGHRYERFVIHEVLPSGAVILTERKATPGMRRHYWMVFPQDLAFTQRKTSVEINTRRDKWTTQNHTPWD